MKTDITDHSFLSQESTEGICSDMDELLKGAALLALESTRGLRRFLCAC